MVLNPEHTWRDFLSSRLRAVYDTAREVRLNRQKQEPQKKQKRLESVSEGAIEGELTRSVYEESEEICLSRESATMATLGKRQNPLDSSLMATSFTFEKNHLVTIPKEDARSDEFLSFRAEFDSLKQQFCESTVTGRSLRLSKRTLVHLDLKDYLLPNPPPNSTDAETERSNDDLLEYELNCESFE